MYNDTLSSSQDYASYEAPGTQTSQPLVQFADQSDSLSNVSHSIDPEQDCIRLPQPRPPLPLVPHEGTFGDITMPPEVNLPTNNGTPGERSMMLTGRLPSNESSMGERSMSLTGTFPVNLSSTSSKGEQTMSLTAILHPETSGGTAYPAATTGSGPPTPKSQSPSEHQRRARSASPRGSISSSGGIRIHPRASSTPAHDKERRGSSSSRGVEFLMDRFPDVAGEARISKALLAKEIEERACERADIEREQADMKVRLEKIEKDMERERADMKALLVKEIEERARERADMEREHADMKSRLEMVEKEIDGARAEVVNAVMRVRVGYWRIMVG